MSAKEVKIFGLGDLPDRPFSTLFDKFYDENKALAIKRAATGSLLNLLPTAGILRGLCLMLARTLAGRLTIGDLTFLVGSFARSRGLHRKSLQQLQQCRRAGALHQRSVRLLRDRANHRFGPERASRSAADPNWLRFSKCLVRLPGLHHMVLTTSASNSTPMSGSR